MEFGVRQSVKVCTVGVLVLGMSLGMTACSKKATSQTEESTEVQASVTDWESLMASLDGAMNFRYNGYNKGVLASEYLKDFDTTNSAFIASTFEDDTKSLYYSLDSEYKEIVADLKRKVEADGGVLNEDFSITYLDDSKDGTGGKAHRETSNVQETQGSEDVTDGYLGEPDPLELEYADPDVDPRLTDIYDLNGLLIWSAKTQGEIDQMTSEEVSEFNRIYQKNEDDYIKHYQEVLRRAEAEKNKDKDTGDADLDLPERFSFNINELRASTSEFIEEVDGKYAISWKYIAENFDRKTQRLDYNLLGYGKYIDISQEHEKMSPLIFVGNASYKFIRDDYELFDDNTFCVTYKSFTENNDEKYKLEILGKLVDGKISLDNTNMHKIIDLYE